MVLIGAGGLLVLLAGFRLALAIAPYPELDAWRTRSYGIVLRDRNRLVLRAFPARDGVKREWAPLSEIPPNVARIFLEAEDQRFYFHPGVDPLAVLTSAVRNARAGRVVSGASTVTMQLARLIRPRRGGSRPAETGIAENAGAGIEQNARAGLGEKISEAWDALRLEAKLSKREILELWLNAIPFGSNIEGLPAMARARFGVDVPALDECGALLLAVTPRRPAALDPAAHPQAAARAAFALSQRGGFGVSSEELYAAAVRAAEPSPEKAPFHAPQFTERAREVYAKEGLHDGVTTLDLNLQEYAEGLLAEEVAGLANNRVSQGAVLAIDNETGAARVYVGSANWDAKDGQVDGVTARNQPGSCLKPFLYARAIDSGWMPCTVLPDLPTAFGGAEAYWPENFNNRFSGPVRLRTALASSLNVPAVWTLEHIGVAAFEDFLARLGFNSVAETRGTHGTGLALGNAEVSLEELVCAFASFPRGGVPARLLFFESADTVEAGAPVMSPYAAWIIADILSDKLSRFAGFGPAKSMMTPFPAMFKTGTANQFQHIWALGASARWTVGVWMGNFSGSTVIGRTGSSIPAKVVNALLRKLEETAGASGTAGASQTTKFARHNLSDKNAQDKIVVFDKSSIIGEFEEVEICPLSGMARGRYCPGCITEYLRPADAAAAASAPCNWHRASGVVYPPEYAAFLAERFYVDEAARDAAGAVIRIPVRGAVFFADPALPADAQAVRLEAAGFAPEAVVRIDGVPRAVLSTAGVAMLPLEKGIHRVEVNDGAASAETEYEVR